MTEGNADGKNIIGQSTENNKTKIRLGILGGMGPMAGVYFNQQLIESTDAKCDQDHIETILYNKTDIPDRTECILEGSTKAADAISEGIKFLKKSGCSDIIIACNTAHYYYEELIKNKGKINIINIIEETCKNIFQKGINDIILLATDGTVKSGIYKKYTDKYGLKIIYPEENYQKKIMEIIYGLKNGKNIKILKNSLKNEIKALTKTYGTENIILGCTELSVLGKGINLDKKIFDPINIVIGKIIQKAGE